METRVQLKTRLAKVLLTIGGLVFTTSIVFLLIYIQLTNEGGKPPAISYDDDTPAPWVRPDSGSTGDHHALVIMYYPAGNPAPTISRATVTNILNTRIAPYLYDVSRGLMTLHGVIDPNAVADIVGWVPYSGVIIQDGAMASAKQANPNINFQNYSWIFFLGACPSSCGEGGVSGSYSSKPTPDGFVIFSNPTVAEAFIDKPNVWLHELGHTIGFGDEGNFMNCGTTPYGQSGSSCTSLTYKDPADPMGGGTVNTPFYHGAHRDKIGWLRSGEVTTFGLTDTGTKTYQLSPYELFETNLKVVRVERSLGVYAYVEYRQPIGQDAFIPPATSNLSNGALIHYGGPAIASFLIDADPTGGANAAYSALTVNKSYTDDAGHFRITTTAVTSTVLTVTVTRT